MKKIFKIFTLFVLLLFTAVLFAFSVSAKSAYSVECKNSEYADAIYLYSYDAQSVIYSKNEKKIISPASTVKIMTGLLACERLSDRLDERVTITDEMLAGHEGISMGLKIGSSYFIKDLLYGSICGGYNDAAQCLAVICSGSVDDFVREMNLRASRLEMRSTVYKNPSGLDHVGAQTTISDVAILSKVAVKNELYMKISSTKSYSYKNAEGLDATLYNRNALISHFTANQYVNKYANGLNAGSTDNGGYVVSTLAKANGMDYLCIVMGAENEGGQIYSYKIANELIDNAVSKFGSIKIISKNEKVSTLPVECALTTDTEIKISCITEEDVYGFVPKNVDLNKQLEYRVYFHDTALTAPISKGDILGGMNVYLDGKLVGSTRIISNTTVAENSFLIFMKNMKEFLLSRYFLTFVVIVIPALAIFLYFDFRRQRRTKVGYVKYKRIY